MSGVICIDPGHGGYDSGAVGKANEKDFTLTVALDLKRELESRGVAVVMTRTTDAAPGGATNVNDDLRARAGICNSSGADLFLSIHANASQGHNGTGAEAYVWPGGKASGVAAELVQVLAPIMGVHGLAVKDGGPNGTNFYVIRETAPPAILLEIGFIDGPDFPVMAEYLHEFGKILAPPLAKFLGGAEVVKATAPPGVAEALALIKNAVKILEG